MSFKAEPVKVPSHGVIKCKTGKYRYVFHVLKTYRNVKGQPTNDRVRIGILVPGSEDMMIPNERFFQLYPQSNSKGVTPTSLQLLEVKSIGASFLVSRILQDLGVSRILNQILDPKRAESVLTVATYMTCRGNVMEYIEDWCDEFSLKTSISPQILPIIFSSIKYKEKITFFKSWIEKNNTVEYLAYDVTSFSTYAKCINDAEYGYNRDREKLPQINFGCYLSYQTKLPIFYVTYPGSIVDKSNMPYIMQYNKELDIKDVVFIMDRGFCSTSNLRWLHTEEIKYLMAVDLSHKTTCAAINEVRDAIDKYWNRCGDDVFGRTIHGRYYGVRGDMHVYYSPDLHQCKRADLYRLVDSQKEKLEQIGKMTTNEAKKFRRFYDIKIEKNGEFKFSLNYEKMEKEEKNCGFYCIFSNTGISIDKIHSIYKDKDIIEKGFDDLKNHIDMKRLRTHNDDTTNGKMFCAFISLIAVSSIAEKLRNINKQRGKRRLSKRGLISELEKIKVISLSEGQKLMNSLTKKQREILEAFGFEESDLRSYALRD
jgi:transposase